MKDYIHYTPKEAIYKDTCPCCRSKNLHEDLQAFKISKGKVVFLKHFIKKQNILIKIAKTNLFALNCISSKKPTQNNKIGQNLHLPKIKLFVSICLSKIKNKFAKKQSKFKFLTKNQSFLLDVASKIKYV